MGLLFFFLICILVSIPVLLYLMNRIEYVRYEYEIKELKQCRQKLQRDQKYLDLQKASLETPYLIEEKARRELSLISHDEGGHLVVVHFEHEDRNKENLAGEHQPELVAQKRQKLP